MCDQSVAKFWMVYRLGGHAPTRTHDTLLSAIAEANRLAAKEVGQVFVILEAKEAVVSRTQNIPLMVIPRE